MPYFHSRRRGRMMALNESHAPWGTAGAVVKARPPSCHEHTNTRACYHLGLFVCSCVRVDAVRWAPSFEPHPRVEIRIQKVDREIRHDVDDAREEHEAHEAARVEVLDGARGPS